MVVKTKNDQFSTRQGVTLSKLCKLHYVTRDVSHTHTHGYFVSRASCILTYLVEIKWKLPGYRTVQPGLEVRGPILRKYVFAASVPLANSGHAGVHTLTAVDVLDRGLAEKEEHVVVDVVRAHKIRLWKSGERRDTLRPCFHPSFRPPRRLFEFAFSARARCVVSRTTRYFSNSRNAPTRNILPGASCMSSRNLELL